MLQINLRHFFFILFLFNNLCSFAQYILPENEEKIELTNKSFIALLQKCPKYTYSNDSIFIHQDTTLCFNKAKIAWEKKYFLYQLNEVFKDSLIITETQYFGKDSSEILITYDTTAHKIKHLVAEKYSDIKFDTLYDISNKITILEHQQQLYYLKNDSIVKLPFQKIKPISKHYYASYQNQKWGIVDTNFIIKIEHKFLNIDTLNSSLLITKDSSGIQLLNQKLVKINSSKIDTILSYKSPYIKYKINNKTGLLLENGKTLINPEYQNIEWNTKQITDTNGNILVQNSEMKYGLISNKGKTLLPCEYLSIRTLKNNIYGINKSEIYGYHPEGVWGYYDSKANKIIISPKYDAIDNQFENNLAIVGHYVMKQIKPAHLELRYGVIDTKGKTIIPFLYKKIVFISNQVIAVQNEDFLWGFINYLGKELSICQFEKYELINHDIKVIKKGKEGLLNSLGLEIYPPKYKNISAISTGGYSLETFQSYTLFHDSLGFAQLEFDTIYPASPGLFVFGLNGYFGLINTKGKIILENKYTYIDQFINGSSVVQINQFYGLVNQEGKYLLNPEYDKIEKDKNGRIRIQGKEIHDYGHTKVVVSEIPKWGLADSLGKTILEFKHNQILTPSDSMYPVQRAELWGFYNYASDFIIPFQFSKIIQPFHKGLAVVTIDSIRILINKNGEILNKLKYDSIRIFDRNTILVKRKNKFGLINSQGDEILPNCYQNLTKVANLVFEGTEQDTIKHFINAKGVEFLNLNFCKKEGIWSENHFITQNDTMYCIFKPSGRQVIKPFPRFESVDTFSNSYARMKYGEKYGFIDLNGKIRISSQYENTKHFNEEMCAVFLKKKWGFIDKAERLCVQPYYDSVCYFQGGIAAVQKNNKWAFVDKEGKEHTKFLYSDFVYCGKGYYAVKRNEHWGMLNPKGEEFVFTKYERVEMIENQYVKIYQEGKWGVANLKGEIVVPLEYNKISFDSVTETIIAQ